MYHRAGRIRGHHHLCARRRETEPHIVRRGGARHGASTGVLGGDGHHMRVLARHRHGDRQCASALIVHCRSEYIGRHTQGHRGILALAVRADVVLCARCESGGHRRIARQAGEVATSAAEPFVHIRLNHVGKRSGAQHVLVVRGREAVPHVIIGTHRARHLRSAWHPAS
jgi:hypothetical protein